MLTPSEEPKKQKNKKNKRESKYEFDLKKNKTHKELQIFILPSKFVVVISSNKTPLESKQSEVNNFLLLHSEFLRGLHSLSLSLSLSLITCNLCVYSKDKRKKVWAKLLLLFSKPAIRSSFFSN